MNNLRDRTVMHKALICAQFIILFCAISSVAPADDSFLMDPIPYEPKAKPFSLPDLKGKPHGLESFGGKHLLVNFWATSCAPCVQELAALHHQHEQLKGEGLEVVAIHAGPDSDAVKEFIKSNPVGFTVLMDSDLSMGDWGIPGLPTTYLVNPSGHVIYRSVGDRNWASPAMMDFLQSVLNADET